MLRSPDFEEQNRQKKAHAVLLYPGRSTPHMLYFVRIPIDALGIDNTLFRARLFTEMVGGTAVDDAEGRGGGAC